jgi:hypothetical protein
MDDKETGTGIPVTPSEVAEVLENFRPGSVVPSFEIFLAYDRLMKEYRQPLASRVALGRALTEAGCSKTRTRKRVSGKTEETRCWRIASPPGFNLVSEDDRQARAVIERVGPGIHSNTTLYRTYTLMASEKVWRGRMSEADLARALTRLGIVRQSYKGQACRYIPDNSSPAPKAIPRPVPRVDFQD